ncbi:MAG: hypothetical protein LBD63_01205, partial [Mycoplasmataceae bacterium]|nr:hypothetical protein [Mycoplasmataceae bacterium]
RKMRDCIYDKESIYKSFRINYNLVIQNVREYNEIQKEQELFLIKSKQKPRWWIVWYTNWRK